MATEQRPAWFRVEALITLPADALEADASFDALCGAMVSAVEGLRGVVKGSVQIPDADTMADG